MSMSSSSICEGVADAAVGVVAVGVVDFDDAVLLILSRI